MKVRYREGKDIRDLILDFSESRFSYDEIVKQLAQRIHDNQAMQFLVIENCELHEKGAHALRQAILGHKSLRHIVFNNLLLCSYPASTDDEYFFPKDLDNTVEHLCAILRDARLNTIELIDLNFRDRTQRQYQHFDMVDPSVMRDLLLQEKAPLYLKEITYSLNHNPHLTKINFSTVDSDVTSMVKEIEENIKKRQAAERLNEVFQGTHAAVEAYLMPEIFKFVALHAWIQSRKRKFP